MSSPAPAPEPPAQECWNEDPFPLMFANADLPCPWQQWSVLGGIIGFLCCCCMIILLMGGRCKNR